MEEISVEKENCLKSRKKEKRKCAKLGMLKFPNRHLWLF
jgi:hypothetical protein